MKTCSQCNTSKPLDQFYKWPRSKDGYTAACKFCKLAKNRSDYATDETKRNSRLSSVQEARKARREYVWDYLKLHPCVDCGNSDLRVLEFDHVRGEKVIGITRAMQMSWPLLLAELPKCDVRCANCHRIKTYTQLGWNLPESN